MLHLADNIKRIRTFFGKSQRKFGEMLGDGVSKDMIFSWENETAKPNSVYIELIASLIGADTEQLKNEPIDVKAIRTAKITKKITQSEAFQDFEERIIKLESAYQILRDHLAKLKKPEDAAGAKAFATKIDSDTNKVATKRFDELSKKLKS